MLVLLFAGTAFLIIQNIKNQINIPSEQQSQITSSTTISKIESSQISDISSIDLKNDSDSEKLFTDTEEKIEQPENFISLLEKSEYSLDSIAAEQLVFVQSDGNRATLYCFEKDDKGIWEECFSDLPGFVGSNGVSKESCEGDYKTPYGLYHLDFAFGTKENPGTLMEYRDITYDSYWVDDPNSQYYNTWVEGTQNKDWNSAEHLSDYDYAYSYCVAIGYNKDPIVPGKGSAIFLHCGENPTAGCVAVSTENMINILNWLNKDKNPYIVIF